MDTLDNLFVPGDHAAFVSMVRENLERGAATKRQLSSKEYIQLARECWNECPTDAVYAMKMLIDPLVRPEFLEEVPEKWANSRDLFCELIAAIDSNGELLNAPPEYIPPLHPNVLLAVIPAGSPTAGTSPDPSAPADYMVAFLDVLGFKVLLTTIGLEELIRRYKELIETALRSQSEAFPWSMEIALVRNNPTAGLMWLPIQTSYFSDSLLLWVNYHPQHVAPFFDRCAKVFCKALEIGLPIRGAISIGNAVLDKSNGIYLGQPLVEVAELEKHSNWVGVSLGASWKSQNLRPPIPPDRVFVFEPPLTEQGRQNFSGLVLDWPRIWRESRNGTPMQKLSELCEPDLSERTREKYAEAARFVEYSDKNQNWFLPEGSTRITLRDL